MKYLFIIILLTPLLTQALQSAPCMNITQARKFDFWVGEWDAYVTGTEQLAGQSKIEIASGGCMIREYWTSAGQPSTGKSMNFVDPVTRKWKQVWVGVGGINVTEFLNGEYYDNVLRFEYETVSPTGKKQFNKFHFYNISKNEVSQLHQSSEDGANWVTTYDFTYKRKA